MAIADIDPADAKLVAQAKAAAAARAAAAVPAPVAPVATPKAADPSNQAMLDQALALKAKLEAQLIDAQKRQQELYVAQGLNPDGSKKTATQVLQEKRDAATAARSELEAKDPLFNKAAGAPPAPAGSHYTWIGGTTTGQWQLYPNSSLGTTGGGADTGTGGTGAGTTSGTLAATPTGPTLAKDVFKQTLAIYFGQAELAKPWMDELYNLSAPLYKSGATMDEALNMALIQGRNNPALAGFTNRFQGLFALQDAKVAGKAVNVPTIAEYYAAEAGMGAVLRQANLGDLANENFLGGVIGKGLSVTDVGNYINNIYTEIQNLPADIKQQVGTHYPALDNVSLAKSILTGDKGFAQLQQDLTTYEIQAAGSKQGLGTYNEVTGTYSGLTDAQARSLAGQGYTLNTAMTGLGQVALAAPTYQKLTEISGNAPVNMTQAQQDLIDANMGKMASQQRKIEQEAAKEAARFSGASGASRGAFSTGYLNKQASSGLF